MITVVTSFFVVRGLANAISIGATPLTASFSGDSLLSRVSEAALGKMTSSSRATTANVETDVNNDKKIQAAAERQLEYLHCLLMNLHAPAVRRVLLLVQDAPSARLLSDVVSTVPAFQTQRDKDASKLVPILFRPPESTTSGDAQPLYSDLFGLAKQLLHPSHDIAAVCNSDVHFHTKQMAQADFAAELCKGHSLKRGLALTRYEECGDSFHQSESAANAFVSPVTDAWWSSSSASPLQPVDAQHAPLIDDYRGSHDAFLMRPGDLSNDFIQSVAHPQNAYQSENVVVHELLRDGFVLRNPSKGNFRIAHRHASDVRQWFPPRNDGRYGKVEPV